MWTEGLAGRKLPLKKMAETQNKKQADVVEILLHGRCARPLREGIASTLSGRSISAITLQVAVRISDQCAVIDSVTKSSESVTKSRRYCVVKNRDACNCRVIGASECIRVLPSVALTRAISWRTNAT